MTKQFFAGTSLLICLAALTIASSHAVSHTAAATSSGSTQEDVTQKYFNTACEAVLAGDKSTLRKAYDYDVLDGIANRDHVVRALNDLMKRSHQEAKALFRKGEFAKAADRLELTFDFTAYIADKLDHNINTPDRTPEYWLSGWRLPALKMERELYISALNDYGLYLIKTDQEAEAVRVLQAVISVEPQREIAYLNLADALWHMGRKDDAMPYLQKFKEIRAEEIKEAALLNQAGEAVLNVSCALCPRKDQTKARVDLSSYISGVEKAIKANWHPPKGETTENIVLRFDVLKSGRISNIAVERASSERYKVAALDSLKQARLPRLPSEAPNIISLDFTFAYNKLNKLDKEDLAVKQWLGRLAQRKSAENHAGLAEAYEDDGDFERAREQLLLAIAKSHGAQTKRYDELLKDIDLQIAEVKRELADLAREPLKSTHPMGMAQAALNNQGASALNNGNYPLAIQKLSAALNLDPGYKLARNNLGIAFNNRGIKGKRDTVKALLDFHRAQLLRTNDTASEKNISTAIKSLVKGKDSYALRKEIADVLAARHDDVGAIAEYRRALRIKEDPKIREPLQAIVDRVMSPGYDDNAFIVDPR